MLRRNRRFLRIIASGTVLALPAWYAYQYSSNNGVFDKRDSLSPHNKFYTPCKIISSQRISPSTKLIRVRVPAGTDYPRNQIVHFNIKEPHSQGYRPFTPISLGTDYVEIIVKNYPAPFGEVARYINQLSEGDTLDLHGPHITATIPDEQNLIAIVGGTAIAPIMQLIQNLQSHQSGERKRSLTILYGSKNQQEILLKDSLDDMIKSQTLDMRVVYFVDLLCGSNKDVNLKEGFIQLEDIRQFCPSPATARNGDVKVIVSGNEQFMKYICGGDVQIKHIGGLLGVLGYTDQEVLKL
ncbi:hypothetical protein MP228_002666 [Amoeboaphelidium protococcarum]|nr:hypothetical protein MP228_002666 [Amoeboaphelidium protococcarum]